MKEEYEITRVDGPGAVGVSEVDSPQDDAMSRPDGSGGPTPKRRRVTRACDELYYPCSATQGILI